MQHEADLQSLASCALLLWGMKVAKQNLGDHGRKFTVTT